MTKTCTVCRQDKDATPKFFRVLKVRVDAPLFRSCCRICETTLAADRTRAKNLVDKVQYREPELNWTPTCYGLPKEVVAWSRKSLSRSCTQIAA